MLDSLFVWSLVMGMLTLIQDLYESKSCHVRQDLIYELDSYHDKISIIYDWSSDSITMNGVVVEWEDFLKGLDFSTEEVFGKYK